jgi:hypothetical protein
MIDVAENRSALSPRLSHHHINGGTSNRKSNRIGLAKENNVGSEPLYLSKISPRVCSIRKGHAANLAYYRPTLPMLGNGFLAQDHSVQ